MEKLKRNRFCRISSILGFLFIITFILLSPALINGQSFDSSSLEADNIVRQVLNSNTEFENHTVYLCLWLLNTYNFEYTKGNYIFDMVVSFFWLDPNISTSNWYFTNGYSYPNSEAKILLGKNVTGDVKYEVYRVTAALNTPPNAKDYPFDEITLKISIDSAFQAYNFSGIWLASQSGIDPYFENVNWKTTNVEFLESMHVGIIGIGRPHFDMVITQEKIRPYSSILVSLLPPIFFCFVSAISFLFSLRGLTPVGIRIGLNNSMLVTTILYIISLGSAIPPSSELSIFNMFIFSVLAFLIIGLAVTIFGFANWIKYRNEKKTVIINRWGFLVTIIVPLLLFNALYLSRVWYAPN